MLCPKTGLSLFDELHSGRRDRDVILYAFDLIELNGKDQRGLSLDERKARLADPLAALPVQARPNLFSLFLDRGGKSL